jgi:hypothetical protein
MPLANSRIVGNPEIEFRIAERRSRRVFVHAPGFNLIHYRFQTFDDYTAARICAFRAPGVKTLE